MIFDNMNIEMIFRMFIACLCGIAVGMERKSRAKEAGIRTHCIVACASALMMIISKYGFFDLVEDINKYASDVRLDPSRMAQGIVTGVGFLGAGIIYFQRGEIRGLTTAAGVWAVSGIGMAIGAGMYIIGITAAFMVVVLQIILHGKNTFVTEFKTKKMKVFGVTESGFQEKATQILKELDITLMDISIVQSPEGGADYSLFLEVPKDMLEESLLNIFDYRCSVDFMH